jgi:biotin carboxyl carrier protein
MAQQYFRKSQQTELMKSYKMKINGHDYEVAIQDMNGTQVNVAVNGKSYTVELPETAQPKPVAVKRPTAAPAPAAAAPSPRPAAGVAGAVRSPLPGVVLNINVSVGAAVKRGDVLLVLEAMKMENNIMADRDGTVTSLLVNKGDSVLEGAELVVIG